MSFFLIDSGKNIVYDVSVLSPFAIFKGKGIESGKKFRQAN